MLLFQKKYYYLIVGRLIPDYNSKEIIEGFLKSNTKKKIVVVGDVPYNDNYSNGVKLLASKKVVFTGYINYKIDLTNFKDLEQLIKRIGTKNKKIDILINNAGITLDFKKYDLYGFIKNSSSWYCVEPFNLGKDYVRRSINIKIYF